jgi:hypothetical protein
MRGALETRTVWKSVPLQAGLTTCEAEFSIVRTCRAPILRLVRRFLTTQLAAG